MRDGGRAKRSLPLAPDAHNEALGQTSLHTRSAQTVGDAPVNMKPYAFLRLFVFFYRCSLA